MKISSYEKKSKTIHMVLPKVKKASDRAGADIKIHFWLNNEIPFSYRLLLKTLENKNQAFTRY